MTLRSMAGLLAALILSAGCATTSIDPRIEVAGGARRIAEVIHVEEDVSGQNSKIVSIRVRNKKSDYRKLKYRIVWFHGGVEYHTALSNWRDLSFRGHATAEIYEVAPRVDLDDFQIQIIGE